MIVMTYEEALEIVKGNSKLSANISRDKYLYALQIVACYNLRPR